jgi:signal transduction histidine kinase
VLLSETLRSSTFRLALFSIGLFGLVLFSLLAYVYWTTTTFTIEQSDASLNDDLDVLRKVYNDLGQEGLIQAIERSDRDRSSLRRMFLLADPEYLPVAGALAVWPRSIAHSPAGVGDFEWVGSGGVSRVFRSRWETLTNERHLIAAIEITDLRQFQRRIFYAFALASLFIVLLAGAASFIVTRRTVGRIEGINAASRAIMEGGLQERISLRGSDDEWDQLALNLNAMLDRIEFLMEEVKQVSDNVAHDLRTPLSRMRTRLESASLRSRDAAVDQEVFANAAADLDDVLRMFGALTRISQIEASTQSATFHAVDLSLIAREVGELFDAAAEERGSRMVIGEGGMIAILGDRDLLFDAISNLVDNAIKHGGDNGLITIDWNVQDGQAVLAISDRGPGVPEEEEGLIFRRFYRSERSRCTPGNGLGLSLVAAVARLHGATIVLSENFPGLRVELRFPQTSLAETKLPI